MQASTRQSKPRSATTRKANASNQKPKRAIKYLQQPTSHLQRKQETKDPKPTRLPLKKHNEQKYRLLQCASSTEKHQLWLQLVTTHICTEEHPVCLQSTTNENTPPHPPHPPPENPPVTMCIIHRKTSTLVVICYNTHLYRRTSCLVAIHNERKYPPPHPPRNPPCHNVHHPPKNINFGCNLLQHTSVPKNILSVCNPQRTKIPPPPPPPPPRSPPCYNVHHPPNNTPPPRSPPCYNVHHPPNNIILVGNPKQTSLTPPNPPPRTSL